jgi:GTPase SAR1 family protein
MMTDKGLTDFVKGDVEGNISSPNQQSLQNTQTFISDAISNDAKINELNTDSKPYIVVLIGFPGYGKTSFVSTCYEYLLQNGKIGEYKFYDSDTFIGFERRISARRYSDTNFTSQTKRTIRGEAHLLTFHFHHQQKGNKVIVFSDRSGENYLEYASKKDSITSDILLKYADRLLFFVNCEDIIGRSFLKLKDDYDLLLSNMTSADVMINMPKIDILYNKCDLITTNNRDKFEANKTILQNLFVSSFGESSFEIHDIISNNITTSEELEKLLLDITEHSTDMNRTIIDKTVNLDWVKSIILKA